jgi:hypothetical protein
MIVILIFFYYNDVSMHHFQVKDKNYSYITGTVIIKAINTNNSYLQLENDARSIQTSL